ncbi:MAG: hypothetical protein J1F38_07710 [Muribaculaceae bacterium]|nr:hypothetical protein [Muribaculaceae bacterium]
MRPMRTILFNLSSLIFISSLLFISCNKEDEIRMPEDILGVWSPDETTYLEFSTNNSVYNLKIEYQDGESIGLWDRDVYYYEPGYNLVIYMTAGHSLNVYEIVEMTSESLTWCWVEKVDIESAESTQDITQLIGKIINEAQAGFNLNPEYFESFKKIPKDKFLLMLESLDIEYPWL